MANSNVPLPSFRIHRLSFWLQVIQFAFTALPTPLRVRIYDCIFRMRIAQRGRVRRLPFGLVLKMGQLPLIATESKALEIVGKLEGVNLPVLFDSIFIPTEGRGFMVSTWIEGDMMGDIWDDLTIEDKQRMVDDLHEQLGALRGQTQCPQHVICSATGGPVLDFRIPWIVKENPRTFDDPRDFAAEVWPGLDHDNIQYRVALRPVMQPVMNRIDVPISLCHGDPLPKNIIIEDGLESWRSGTSRLALIDWEHAGWMPIYWDAVKATWLEDEADSEYTLMFRQIFSDTQVDQALDADWQWRLRANIPMVYVS